MNTIKSYTRLGWLLAGILLLGSAASGRAVTITLAEWGINGDTTIYAPGDSLPGYINTASFDFATGLGTITASIAGKGDHYFALFVDHEIDETLNTFYNEYGTGGTPISGQSWEIDEPGWDFGDIYDNFLAGALDNSNGVDSTSPDDVSMALAWNFSLGLDEHATIQMLIGQSQPSSGFYLIQTDPDSQASIYYSSSLKINGSDVPDGGSTLALMAFALMGLARIRRPV